MNKIYFSFLVLLTPSLLMGMQDALDEARERKKLFEQHIAILEPLLEATTVYNQNISRWRNILENENESLAKKGEVEDTMRGFNALIYESMTKLTDFYTHEALYKNSFPVFDLSGNFHEKHAARCHDRERCYCKGIQNVLQQNQEKLHELSERIAKVEKNPAQAVWFKVARNERACPKPPIITRDTTTLD